MRAIVLVEPGRLEWREVPAPRPGPGQVRVRTAACGVCATDLAMIAGDPRVRPPAILGHEWAGRVDAVGPGVDPALCGRPCVAENVLADGGEVGFEHPGGYGECLLTEAANLHLLPAALPLDAAALVEPLAVCVRGLHRMGPAAEGPVLVFGDGPIGLLALALLVAGGASADARADRPGGASLPHAGVPRHADGSASASPADAGRAAPGAGPDRRSPQGPRVLVGGRPARLALARDLGATATVNYHDVAPDLASAVLGAARPGGAGTAAGGFPAVIEASGSADALRAALDAAAPDATVLVLGDYGEARAEFPWNRLLHREWRLVGSNASAGGWTEAVRLAAAGAVPLGRLVSGRFPAGRFAEALALAGDRRAGAVKVLIEWMP